MKTRREIFDQVKTHLLTQNAKSEVESGPNTTACMYRAPDGKKCAVGCLITDEAYTPSLEHNNCRSPGVIEALRKSGVDITSDLETMFMLRDLQRVHDGFEPGAWPQELDRIERRYFGG